MDEHEFNSAIFQRPFQYLRRVMQAQKVDNVNVGTVPEGTSPEMLECLLTKCGIGDPSWAELRHFVWFLNSQLLDTELSDFCLPIYEQDLPGFRLFVVNFMIHMSKVRTLTTVDTFNMWDTIS